MRKLKFTSADDRSKFAGCLAIHQRDPLLAITDCPEDQCFVLDLRCSVTAEDARRFLDGVEAGTVVAAKKGAAPRQDDAFDEGFDILLSMAKCGVQSTYKRLVGRQPQAAHTTKTATIPAAVDHRSIAVLYSDVCPCCPPLLRTIDHLFLLASEHIKGASCASPTAESSTAGAPGQLGGRREFTFVVCNVDENELDEEDWPQDAEQQVVPMINGYVNGDLTRFTGVKSGAKLIQFVAQILAGPQECAVQNLRDRLTAAVKFDCQGRILLSSGSVSPVPSHGLGGKSKRTRSGRDIASHELSELAEMKMKSSLSE
jgi:hypothetical protein